MSKNFTKKFVPYILHLAFWPLRTKSMVGTLGPLVVLAMYLES